jgi:hypothetical protein
MTYDIGNPGPGLGQAKKCGGDPNPSLLITGSQTAIHFCIYTKILFNVLIHNYLKTSNFAKF